VHRYGFKVYTRRSQGRRAARAAAWNV